MDEELKFNVISKAIEYKVIHYKEDDKRCIPILISELGGSYIYVDHDKVMIRMTFGNNIKNWKVLHDGDYILIPNESEGTVKILSNIDELRRDYLILL